MKGGENMAKVGEKKTVRHRITVKKHKFLMVERAEYVEYVKSVHGQKGWKTSSWTDKSFMDGKGLFVFGAIARNIKELKQILRAITSIDLDNPPSDYIQLNCSPRKGSHPHLYIFKTKKEEGAIGDCCYIVRW